MGVILDLLFWDFIYKDLAKGKIKDKCKVVRFERQYPWIKRRYEELKGCKAKNNINKYLPMWVEKCYEDEICVKLMEEFGISAEDLSDFTDAYFWWYA